MSAPARALCLAAILLIGSANLAFAQSCRARAIIASQCTWFVLDEVGGDRRASAQAQREATSTLIAGCSQGQYQMVLLRGTGITDSVLRTVKSQGIRDTRTIRATCRAAAAQAG